MNELLIIKNLFVNNPEFIMDIIHAQHLKTQLWSRDWAQRRIFGHFKKSTNWIIGTLLYAEKTKSHKKINGEFVFEDERDENGVPIITSFFDLFSQLLKYTQGSRNSEDMLSKLYSSDVALLIRMAEKLKDRKPAIHELFDIISCEECNTTKDWTVEELLSNKWDFKLLSLNEKVWFCFQKYSTFSDYLKCFDSEIQKLKINYFPFQTDEAYLEYCSKVNLEIKEMFLNLDIQTAVWKKLKKDLYKPGVLDELILLDDTEHIIIGKIEDTYKLCIYMHFDYLCTDTESIYPSITSQIDKSEKQLEKIRSSNGWNLCSFLFITTYRLSSYPRLELKDLPWEGKSNIYMNDYPNYKEVNFKMRLDTELAKQFKGEALFNYIIKKGLENRESESWDCEVCDGDEETGCLMSDPQNCPYGRGID